LQTRGLGHVIELDHEVGHSDLQSDTAILEQVRQERDQATAGPEAV
jgi:hypothetical protein